jgi:flagellar motor switch protein FliM
MSSRATNSLSREKIHQLLAAVGTEPVEDISQTEAAQCNWHDPHYFSSEQLAKLDDFTQAVASAMAAKFSDWCRSRYDVTITGITQHFADEFSGQLSDNEQMDYYLVFGADREHPLGLIGSPEKTARIWARQLLGDSESEEDSGKALSQLEESLLLDLTSALIEAFSTTHASGDFRPAESAVRGRWPLELCGTEELCRISFDVKRDESGDSSGAYFVILCRVLDTVVGKDTKAVGQLSADEISRTLIGHLHEIPISVTTELASTSFALEEIMNLQVNDVLLLGKKVDEPVELIVNGRSACHGWLAKSAGKYAVAITERDFSLAD